MVQKTHQLGVRTLAMAVLAAAALHAQTVLEDPKKIADARKLFDTLSGDTAGCEVLPIRPHFVFSLRVHAGYEVRLRQDQGQQWIMLTSITPLEGNDQPIYLSEVTHFPIGGVSGLGSKIEGSYWLGEGRYTAKFLMFDSRGDVCRKSWQIDARLSSGGVHVKAKPVGRVTILLHAASVLQKQTMLGKLDKAMLLDGIVALLDELPAASVRVVVFNLEQQRELFRQDGFTLEALPRVAQVLDAVQPATVDYRAAQNPAGPAEFLERLLNQEMQASDPSDAVIFLGSKSIYRAKPFPGFRLSPGAKQRFFYLVCEPTRFLLPRSSTLPGAGWSESGRGMALPPRFDPPDDLMWTNYGPNHAADSIQHTVGQLNGKTLQVDSTVSFAHAVAVIAHQSRP